ncbi:MAG: glucose 1-dehydrogenase [Actinobacteria bacterium]|nr:glucose 1-dehydrogenase [Actinomycetota bacterium]
MDLSLGGRVAVVTGGSQGIGREIARLLAAEGADLVIVARRTEVLERTAAELRALGRRAIAVTGDVATPDGPAAIADAALAEFGHVDIVINNAGKGHNKPLEALTDDDWQASLDLNLMSAVRMCRALVPQMRARGWGRIVNISTRVALEPDPYFAAYGASKAGLVNFSKNLANAYSRDGVLTNCIVPGLIRSEAIDQAAEKSAAETGLSVEEVMARTLKKRPIPAGRLGEPADVAGLVALLCSDRGSWITGACFTIDGGIVRSDR